MHKVGLYRLLWSASGATLALSFAMAIAGPSKAPLLLASLGGSTVFLFGLTGAAAAQPRALLGGHFGATLTGIACYQVLGAAPWVYVLASVLAMVLMLLTRTMHPPAGANAMLLVHAHANWGAFWQPVVIGVVALAVTAAIWSRLFPGAIRYPVAWMEPSPPQTTGSDREKRH